MRELFTRYETCLDQLLDRLGSDHPRYSDALTLKRRLQENISQYWRYGDSQDLRAERARILDALDRFARETLGKSFDELCRPAQISQISTKLRDSVQVPDVRAAIAAFQADFQDACKHIDALADYKDLHDQLHKLQRCYDCIDCIRHGAKRGLLDQGCSDILREYEYTLQEVVGRLRCIAGRESFAESEIYWLRNLDRARECLHRAVEKADMEQLNTAVWLMNRVLASQPARINTHLYHSAHALCLPALVKAMKSVHEHLARLDPDSKRAQQLEAGVLALGALSHELVALRDEHDEWQKVDLEFRRIEANLNQDKELEWSWPFLKAMAEPLYDGKAEEWAVSFSVDATKLGSAIAAQDHAKARQYFRRYRRQASIRFYQVDVELKELCDELRKGSELLPTMLRMIE